MLGFPIKNGALAQLGERLICIQEVRSSILLGSTNAFLKEKSVPNLLREYSFCELGSQACLFCDILKRRHDWPLAAPDLLKVCGE